MYFCRATTSDGSITSGRPVRGSWTSSLGAIGLPDATEAGRIAITLAGATCCGSVWTSTVGRSDRRVQTWSARDDVLAGGLAAAEGAPDAELRGKSSGASPSTCMSTSWFPGPRTATKSWKWSRQTTHVIPAIATPHRSPNINHFLVPCLLIPLLPPIRRMAAPGCEPRPARRRTPSRENRLL